MIDRVWFVFPVAGHVRISTVLTAAAVLLVVWATTRKPILAVVAVFGWLSAYEILFNGIGVVFERWPVNTWDWVAASLMGWVVASWLAGVRPAWPFVVVFSVGMIVWVLTGYHSNVPTGRPWSTEGEVLNEITKTALAIGFLLGALRSVEKKELVKALVDRDRGAGIGRRLQLDGVGAWLNRTLAYREVPESSVLHGATSKER